MDTASSFKKCIPIYQTKLHLIVSKTSLRLCVITSSLCQYLIVTRFCFQHTLGTIITISEVSSTQYSPFIRLPTQNVMCTQRCFTQTIHGLTSWETKLGCHCLENLKPHEENFNQNLVYTWGTRQHSCLKH
jgi:hypothetical protein